MYWMITDAYVDMTMGEIKFILGPYLNLGVINKNGQIVNNKTFLGMIGTMIAKRGTRNHQYGSIFEIKIILVAI